MRNRANDSVPDISSPSTSSCGCDESENESEVVNTSTSVISQSYSGRRKSASPVIKNLSSNLRLFGCCLWLVIITTIICSPIGATDPKRELPDLNTIPTPPSFSHEPNDKNVYFVLDGTQEVSGTNTFQLKERTFRCRARAYPEVKFRWEKDGKQFNLSQYSDRITKVPGEGTFILSKLRLADEGVYQCYAENGNGTAKDQQIDFKRAWIQRFQQQDPKLVDVELGDPFARHCDPPESEPEPRVYWIFMGQDEREKFSTINSSLISSDQEGNIYFHAVRDEDFQPEKYYTCTAENTQLQDYKFGNQFQLNVNKNKRRTVEGIPPQEQFVSPSPVIAVMGRSIQIHCFFSGFMPPKPLWYKGDMAVRGVKNKIDFPNYGKSLEIKNVTYEDGGEYECQYSKAPQLNRKIQVNVEAAPYWASEPPASKNSSQGQTVTFVCGAIGKPKPTYTFYKNGEDLQAHVGAKYEIVGNRLIIRNLEKSTFGRGDNAVYQCKAENKHGYVWANFYLNILQFRPILLDNVPEDDAVLGKDKILWCKFFGSPLPNVTWHGAKLAGQVVQDRGSDEKGVGRLVIKEITKNGEGRYSCLGTNDYGKDEGFVNLKVREATRMIEFPSNQSLVAGQPVRLPCYAQTDPELSVTYNWTVDGDPLPQDLINSGHYKIDKENTLIIEEPRKFDTASYTCTAGTRLDNVTRTAYLEIKDVPSPVFSAFIHCEGQMRSVAVNFVYTEQLKVAAPVQEFWVQYQIDPETDNGAWTTHNVPVKKPFGSSQTIHTETKIREIHSAVTVDLNPFGKYKFRVIARNEVGDSSPVEVKQTCDTPADVPEMNPTGVKVKGNTADNLVVYWEPMPREEWNGPDFHYVVKYKKQDEDGEGAGEGGDDGEGGGGEGEDGDDDGVVGGWHTKKIEDPYADHTIIEGTGTYEPYDVQVGAVNAIGEAQINPETVGGFSGQGIPEVTPSGFRCVDKSGTSATFVWDRVDETKMNGDFGGYKVVHWYEDKSSRKKRSAGVRKEVVFGTSETRGTVYDMKPNVDNYAQIMVFNGANDGPPSETIPIKMPEGVATPVRQLKVFPVADDIVGLLWKPPRELNGNLQYYQIRHCPILSRSQDGVVTLNENDCVDSLRVDAPSTFVYVKELNSNSEYRFTVFGVTGGGQGDPNSIDAKTLPENIPEERSKMLIEAGVADSPPVPPLMNEAGIGEDHLNVTWQPGLFDPDKPQPVGDDHYFMYREKGEDDWQEARPIDRNFTVMIDDLEPGTTYEVRAVSVAKNKDGSTETSESPSYFYTTAGGEVVEASFWWIILLIIIIVLILIILCIACVIVRSRGAKYPVSEKEKEQGREPMLGKEEKGFGEYAKPDNEEKRSLTGSKPESETDSMAEYGEGDAGRFTEDGSFIGQYVPNKMLVSAQPQGTEKGTSNVSTFV